MQMSSQLLHKRIERLGDERAARLSENILRSGGQLLTFVKEFLANAAADHGVALKPATLSFSDAAAQALQKYAEAARRKQLVLDTKLPNEGTAVLADASALDQVLDNLLSNALKFTRRVDTFSCPCTRAPGRWNAESRTTVPASPPKTGRGCSAATPVSRPGLRAANPPAV